MTFTAYSPEIAFGYLRRVVVLGVPGGRWFSVGLIAQNGGPHCDSGEVPGMNWKDRLLLKMMNSRVLVKVFGNPVFVKVLTLEVGLFIRAASLSRRRKPRATESRKA